MRPDNLPPSRLLQAVSQSLIRDSYAPSGGAYRLLDRDLVPDAVLRLRVVDRLAPDFVEPRRLELAVFLPLVRLAELDFLPLAADSSCFCNRSRSF
jgi:hypothetical protein